MNSRQKTGLAFTALAVFAVLAVQQLQGTWTTTVEPKLNLLGIQSVYKPAHGRNVIFSREDLRNLDLRVLDEEGTTILDLSLRFENGAPPVYGLPPHAFVQGNYRVQGTGTFAAASGEPVTLPLRGEATIGSESIVSFALE